MKEDTRKRVVQEVLRIFARSDPEVSQDEARSVLEENLDVWIPTLSAPGFIIVGLERDRVESNDPVRVAGLRLGAKVRREVVDLLHASLSSGQ